MNWLATSTFLCLMILHGSFGRDDSEEYTDEDLCRALRSWIRDETAGELFTVMGCKSLMGSCGQTNPEKCPPHPWVVSIRRRRTRQHICVGTLVSDQHVVTAASCFYKGMSVNDIEVGFGSPNIRFLKYLSVRKLQVHDGYAWSGTDNDLAVLTLMAPARFTDPCTQPICMPSYAQYPSSRDAITVGWGVSKKYSHERTSSLRTTRMTIVRQDTCRFTFPNVLHWDSTMCSAPSDYRDAICSGYTGAPLMVEYSGKWFLHGVSSKIQRCESPSVFTTVPYYSRWISRMGPSTLL